METKAHYALVGFFAIALAVAAAVFAVWLGQVQFDQEFEDYEILFDGPVRGLTEASEVRFNGIKVGEVVSLSLESQDRPNVIARIRVIAETPVRTDTIAQLEPQGLTGLSYIQLSASGDDAPMMTAEPGDLARIPSRQAQIETLIEGGEDVVEQAREAIARVNALLTEENLTNVGRTLDNIAVITANLRETGGLVGHAEAALDRLEAAGASITVAAADVSTFATASTQLVEGDLATMVRETTAASIAVNEASLATLGLIEDIAPPATAFANDALPEATLALSDLRALATALETLAQAIEDNPTAFIAGEQRREVEITP